MKVNKSIFYCILICFFNASAMADVKKDYNDDSNLIASEEVDYNENNKDLTFEEQLLEDPSLFNHDPYPQLNHDPYPQLNHDPYPQRHQY